MFRMAQMGVSSPCSQRVALVSVPAPFVRSYSSPKTSDSDSLMAPDWLYYISPEVNCVTTWVSSCPTTSSAVNPSP